MSKKNKIDVHSIHIDDRSFRITHDPWTGDWLVEDLDNEYPQPTYLYNKKSAINYCFVRSGMFTQDELSYRIAPDRVS